MSAYTKAEAEAELVVWKAALQAVASGQSYTMSDGRNLTRANLPQIREMVDYFGNIIAGAARGSMRTYNVIPLDT